MEMLDSLSAYSDYLGRTEIEELFQVKARAAQDLMTVIGRSFAAGPVHLRSVECYLRMRGGAGLEAQERARRKQFAAKLTEARREFIETPKCLVDTSGIPKERVAATRRGMAGLPEGVTVEPGVVRVEAGDGDECVRKLWLLAQAIGADKSAFDERIKPRERMAADGRA